MKKTFKSKSSNFKSRRQTGFRNPRVSDDSRIMNDDVEEFHQAAYKHLSLILNKIGCMELGREAEQFITKM